MSSEQQVKIVVIGDPGVGKTSLCIQYSDNRFLEDHIPTVFDNYSTNILVDDEIITLHLWDTAGQGEHERLRILSYAGAHCVLLCYSLTDDVSEENIENQWICELRHYAPNVPVVLVGTKLDANEKPLESANRGEKLRERIAAAKYMECSSKTQTNLKNVFDAAISTGLAYAKNGNSNLEYEKDKAGKTPGCRCLVM